MRSARSTPVGLAHRPWASCALFGVLYVILAMFTHMPRVTNYLARGYFSGFAIILFLGTLFVLRDIIQLRYEQMGRPRPRRWNGLGISMIFVLAGALFTFNFGANYLHIPAAAALILSSLADGVVFSLLVSFSTLERLLYSNVVGAIMHQMTYLSIRSLGDKPLIMELNMFERFIDIAVMAVPALLYMAISSNRDTIRTETAKQVSDNLEDERRARDRYQLIIDHMVEKSERIAHRIRRKRK